MYDGLNPCCNGIYSMRRNFVAATVDGCLNPCCNGIYSMRDTLVIILKKEFKS